MRLRIVSLALALCLGSCAKPSSHDTSERVRQPLEPTADAGFAGPRAEPARREDQDHDTPAGAPRWRGTYHSESATIFVPPEWKGVHWVVPSTSAGLGDGAIELEVRGERVLGAIDGPLGPASVDGVVSGTMITATVLRRDPADRGYSGTLVATISGDGATGTMNLSLAEASAVRTATFSVARGD